MALIKIQRFFGAAPNELLNNHEISFKAKGLYAYLNSKPDDWDFSVESIAAQVKEGIDSVRAGVQELEKFGYLKRVKRQNEKGFWEVDYMLFETPFMNETYLGKSNVGEHPKQYKKEYTKKDNTNTPLSPKGEAKKGEPEKKSEVDYRGIEVAVKKWLQYKKEKGQKYKSDSSVQTMINKLYNYSNGVPNVAIQIIEESMSNNYQGFFPLKTNRDGHHEMPGGGGSARRVHESFKI